MSEPFLTRDNIGFFGIEFEPEITKDRSDSLRRRVLIAAIDDKNYLVDKSKVTFPIASFQIAIRLRKKYIGQSVTELRAGGYTTSLEMSCDMMQ
jgi:hypothetical protein